METMEAVAKSLSSLGIPTTVDEIHIAVDGHRIRWWMYKSRIRMSNVAFRKNEVTAIVLYLITQLGEMRRIAAAEKSLASNKELVESVTKDFVKGWYRINGNVSIRPTEKSIELRYTNDDPCTVLMLCDYLSERF